MYLYEEGFMILDSLILMGRHLIN